MPKKKIIIIGAGIIGLTTAYYLRAKGHEVTLLEKKSQVADGASHFNGSQLAYTYIHPLGHPGILSELFEYILLQEPSVRLNNLLRDHAWYFRLLLESMPSKTKENELALLDLAFKSKECMEEFLLKNSSNFDYSAAGKLVVYSTQKEFRHAADFAEKLNLTHNLNQQILNREEAEKLIPKGLKSPNIEGAVFSEIDAVGDSFKFSQSLAQILLSKGVGIYLDTPVESFSKNSLKIQTAHSKGKEFHADIFVIAGGIGSKYLLNQLDVDIPLHPIKGYTCTIPNNIKLTYSFSDTKSKLVLAPLGNRLRIAGMADIGDETSTLEKNRVEAFKGQIVKLLPDQNLDGIEIQSRIRPCLPSSVPIIKQHTYENLYLNTGHGFLGWTLAMGSAKKLSDLLS